MFSFWTLIHVSGIFSSIFGRNAGKAKEHFEKARVFFEQQEYEEAIVEYKAAIASDPHFDDAYVECADAFMLMNNFENAASCLRSAIEINPKNAKAHNNLGCCLKEFGDLEQAKSEFIKAAIIDHKYLVNVGSTKSSRPMLVSGSFSKDETLAGDLCDNQGNLLLEQREYHKAILLLEKAIELGTTYPAITYNNLGSGYYHTGDFDQAIFYYDKALEIDSDYPLAIKNRELAVNKRAAR